MGMTDKEAQELIDFEEDVLINTKAAVRIAGSNPIVEMSIKIGMDMHQRVIRALREYKR
jgi:hypothetical protein